MVVYLSQTTFSVNTKQTTIHCGPSPSTDHPGSEIPHLGYGSTCQTHYKKAETTLFYFRQWTP